MGFQIGRTFVLDFGEEGETDAYGAVIKMRSGSIEALFEMGPADAAREREIVAEHVIEWNLEDNGVPLPIEPDTFLKLDEPFRNLIWTEWVKASRGISAPFDRRSAGGAPSPAEEPTAPSIPMESL